MDPRDVSEFESGIQTALAAHDPARAAELADRYCVAARWEAPGVPAHGPVGVNPPADPAQPATSPWFRSGYLAAQVALVAGQPSRALERVRPLLDVVGRLPDALACNVHLLAAEALARLGR